jgi:hypothetical protein
MFPSPDMLHRKLYIVLHGQAKRKQALLESNLLGINLMDDKNVKSMGYHCDSPLTFLESQMPLKTHQ